MTQKDLWAGAFGTAYLERNKEPLGTTDNRYRRLYGISGSDLSYKFLGQLPRNLRILEVGCSDGKKLALLWEIGFANLSGVDINREAIADGRQANPHFFLSEHAAQDLGFKDGAFDLVFTNGLLVHIPADELISVMAEMYRCTTKYIWGHEYFSTIEQAVGYRGRYDMLWKRDHVAIWQERFGLWLCMEQIFRRNDGAGFDTMYLMEKQQ